MPKIRQRRPPQHKRDYRDTRDIDKRYEEFFNTYIKKLTDEMVDKPNDKCAKIALATLITDFDSNIKGCFYGLWNAADTMEYDSLIEKIERDITSNMSYIEGRYSELDMPEGCMYHIVRFNNIIFDLMEKQIMDYASR